MKMENIYFIEAKSPGSHIFSKWTLPRLGSILLGTILKQLGYNVKVFIEDITPLKGRKLPAADLICISSITSTITRAFEIAEEYKKLGIPVVIGGPHSTFLPEESLKYTDYVIRGEGEEAIVELVKCLKENKPLDDIRGLSFWNKGQTKHNPSRKLIENLDRAPIPDFSLVHMWSKKTHLIPIATSRGCPFGCKFCSVVPMFGKKYRFKSVDRIIEEIKSVDAKGKHIFFVDDNFTANKKRTKKLLKTLIDKGIKIEWSAQIRTDITKDPELLDLMEKSGCFAVHIGFESINPATLSLYNKNQKFEDVENAIRMVKERHINIHGMFVLGSDTDDIKTIQNTAKFAKKLNIESVQFMTLTPLPGTPIFEELKSSERLIHTDWSKYDCNHAVFEPKLMTAFELHTETLKAMGKFYSWPAIFRNLRRFDFFYAVVGLYGKKSIRKALVRAKSYIDNLQERMSMRFDEKTNGLRKSLLGIKKFNVEILCDQSYRDGKNKDKEIKLEFFKMFFRKIKIIPAIVVEKTPVKELALRIKVTGFMQEKTFFLEPISDFKLCEDLGTLFNVKMEIWKKAYYKAKNTHNYNIEFGPVQITARP